MKVVHKEWHAKAAILLFLLLTGYWIFGLQNPAAYETRFFGDFPSIYGVMALWGGFWGVVIANKWGGLKSIMGKAMLMFSLGLFAQVFGQLAYAYIAFFKNAEVPYPSIGDVGYFGSIPLYIFGVLLLAQASAVKIGLQSFGSKLQALLIPLVMLGAGSFLFLQDYSFDWSNPLKIFLDFGYPLGQAIYISLAILTYLLSRGVLGGVMKNKILFIIFALCIQFLADYTFLYQSSRGIWQVGGINDFMYLIAYFIMTLALIQFETLFKELKHE
jgi:hypothetical protein